MLTGSHIQGSNLSQHMKGWVNSLQGNLYFCPSPPPPPRACFERFICLLPCLPSRKTHRTIQRGQDGSLCTVKNWAWRGLQHFQAFTGVLVQANNSIALPKFWETFLSFLLPGLTVYFNNLGLKSFEKKLATHTIPPLPMLHRVSHRLGAEFCLVVMVTARVNC